MYTVDLGYYYLTSDAFIKVLPELEIAHFSKMERLILRANLIDSYGLLDLCDCLTGAHNTTLKELDLGETQVADDGIKGLIETMNVIVTIVVVELDGVREVSQEMRNKLDARIRLNIVETEKINQNKRL